MLMPSSCETMSERPASVAAARATSSHIASGSGAPASPTTSGCHVRRATPMTHGARGSGAVMRPSSLRLPDRLALLRERLRTFPCVLGLEDLRRDPALLLERRAQL